MGVRSLLAAFAAIIAITTATVAIVAEAVEPPPSSPPPPAGDGPHFYLDLDGVILNSPESYMGRVDPKRLVIAAEVQNLVNDGAPEFIQSLLEIPGARVSFFSAGLRERNLDVLTQIRLPNGRSALESATYIFHRGDVTRIWDSRKIRGVPQEALRHPDQPEDPRFWGAYKKKFQGISSEELDRTILIDDYTQNMARGQEKNVLWLANFYSEYPNSDLERRVEDITPTLENLLRKGNTQDARTAAKRHYLDKNRLAYARGLIDLALEKSREEKIPLREALWRLQWIEESTPYRGQISRYRYRSAMRSDLSILRKGFRAFKRVNPAFHSSPLIPEPVLRKCALSYVLDELSRLK